MAASACHRWRCPAPPGPAASRSARGAVATSERRSATGRAGRPWPGAGATGHPASPPRAAAPAARTTVPAPAAGGELSSPVGPATLAESRARSGSSTPGRSLGMAAAVRMSLAERTSSSIAPAARARTRPTTLTTSSTSNGGSGSPTPSARWTDRRPVPSSRVKRSAATSMTRPPTRTRSPVRPSSDPMVVVRVDAFDGPPSGSRV